MRIAIRTTAFVLVCTLAAPTRAQARCDPFEEAHLRARLDEEAQSARTWRYVWTGINGGLTLVSVAGIPILPRSERGDLIVSAVTGAMSTAFTWFLPLDVEDDADGARRVHASTPARCGVALRRLVAHSAQDESSRFAWPWHVGNFVSALVPALIIWLGLHDLLNGVLGLLSGFALGELELLTQPTSLNAFRTVNVGFAAYASAPSMQIGYAVRW